MEKSEKSIIGIYGIIFIIFNILFLGIPFPKATASWIVYVFSLLAIIVSYFITRYSFRKADELVSKVYGFPVFRIGYIYVGSQLAITLLICLIAVFAEVATWIPLVLSLVLLGCAGIGLIIIDNARDAVKNIEDEVAYKTRTITYFQLDITRVVDACQDIELKKQLSRLAEDIRYSDPVSNEQLYEIESRIKEEVNTLSKLVSCNAIQSAKDKVKVVSNILADRNRMCKVYKK